MASEHRGWQVRQPLGAWWVLPGGLLLSTLVLISGGLRSFGYAMAATMAVAAVVRLLMPDARAGGLMVRSRTWDVVLLLALAGATAVLSATLVIR